MKATSTKLAISLLLVAMTGTGAWAEPVTSASGAADEAARRVAEICKPVEGKVLSALSEKQLLVDVKAGQGAYVGMEMEIFREGQPFKHPVTGEVLGRMDRPVGTVRLVEIQEKFSVAELIQLEPNEKVQPGDGVRITGARLLIGLANVTASAGYEGLARKATREFEVALARTGRFEVIDERRMRSTLIKGGLKEDVPLRNPDALKILRKDLRLTVVALPHVSETGGILMWDVPIISPVSGRLLQSVSVEQTAGDEQKAGAPGAPAPSPSAPAAPKVAVGDPTPTPAWIGPPSQRSNEFLAVPYAGIPTARLVLGPSFDGQVRGVVAADFDGDGKKEVAVAEENRITVYAVEGNKFRQLWASNGQEFERWSDILALDAADINGNGAAEIFVTSFYDNHANSFVLEFKDGAWTMIARDVDVYFRVLGDRDGVPTLYGQREGVGALDPLAQPQAFSGGVKVYRWQNGRYEPTSDVKLPKGSYIYNFAVGDVQNDGGGRDVLQITPESHNLRLYSGTKVRSTVSDRFGGGYFFEVMDPIFQKSAITSQSDTLVSRYYVHPRLLVTDVDGDGKREVVTARNMASSGYVMKNVTVYDQGKIVALRWGGVGFQVLWESQQLDGFVSDFFFGDLGDGGDPVIIFALVQPQKLGLGGAHSGLFVFRLAPPKAQAQAQEAK